METNKIDLLAKDIQYIKDKVNEVSNTLKTDYVTKDQFEPVQKVVYGLVGLILVTVVGALMVLVIKK